MTNISQIDQAIVLLRERLRQMRNQSAAPASKLVKVQSRSAQPVGQLRGVLSMDGVPRRDLRRALVRSLLSEAFGDAVSNDLSFQAVADRVTDMLEADPETAIMLDRAAEQIKRQR